MTMADKFLLQGNHTLITMLSIMANLSLQPGNRGLWARFGINQYKITIDVQGICARLNLWNTKICVHSFKRIVIYYYGEKYIFPI